jgi:FKBP-type peptidyl-prolyl cis-trans isomerase
MEFHRQRALALDSLMAARSASWDSVVTTGTGLRYEVIDGAPGTTAFIQNLPEGLVLELHHRIALLDGREISTWQRDGPMAFELGRTDLPTGFHELIGHAAIGDSIRALIPPSQAWGMSGRPPEIPQEAVISVQMRINRYALSP